MSEKGEGMETDPFREGCLPEEIVARDERIKEVERTLLRRKKRNDN